MRFLFLLFIFTIMAPRAKAQIDPSSAMLLNSGSSSVRVPVRDSGLDSGRYTVKPRTGGDVQRREQVIKVSPTPTPAPALKPNPTPPPAPTPSAVLIPAGPQTPQSTFDSQEDVNAEIESQTAQPSKSGVDERRETMLELSFAPGYLYNESRSTFANRNYFLSAPMMSVDATVWVTPTIGLKTTFIGSLNANVTDSLDNTRNAGASDQWFTAGVRSRHFFGDSSQAPIIQLGLDYREFEFKIPSDAQLRNKLLTTGVFLTLESEVPTSSFGSWVFGADFGPRLQHKEIGNASPFTTGDGVTTTTVGLHLGARYRFDRTQSLFWKISYSAEKNLFTGSTSINDPVTGQPQTNVSVTNSTSMFQLGYTWSD